jgi:branched-chain amino acid transport system substrate-binding protein
MHAGQSFAQSGPAEVRLGSVLSLSGNVAEVGRECKRGIELALDEMTQAGRFKGTKIVRVEEDDASEADKSVIAVQRLSTENVIGIVGGTVSNAVRAALPMAQRVHLPFVVVNAYTVKLTDIGDMAFQVSKPTSDFNTQEVVQVVKRLKLKKAAMLWAQDNPTTVGFRDDFIAGLKTAGIPLVVDEPMKALDTDYNAQLNKAIAAGADLLIPNFNAPQNAAVIKQAHALGYFPTNIGHVGDNSSSFAATGGKDVVGHIANSAFFADGSGPVVQAFVAAYKAKYNATPTAPSAISYQAMRLAGEAIARILDRGQTPTPALFRAELNALGPQPSVLGSTGTAAFNANRVYDYDGYLVVMDENMQWKEWK